MKNFFTLTLCFFTLSLSAQETITYPYNPDANSDQYVAVSDVLETIATYGDQFFPEEIMVGDTTLSNWIQILNQTLSNQQAVIDSLQASLDSQDTQLDSTMIADMIAAAGGLGSGGGCDFIFPQGINGQIINHNLSSDYTVPAGKNLYVTHLYQGDNANISINSIDLIYGSNNGNSSYGGVNNITLYLTESQILSSGSSSSFFQGILTDKVDIEPIYFSLKDNGSYTVPSGKKLVIRTLYNRSISSDILLNGIEIGQGFINHNGNFDRDVISHTNLFLTAADIISGVGTSNCAFNGYLVDEDYFADCGGGGSSGGGLLNTEFGDTEHHSFFELDWQQQTNSSGYFIPLQFESDGIFRISGGNAGFKYILVPDSVSEDQFFNETLAEANFFDTFWEGGNPEFTMPLNSDEQLVLYGGTGVVEEGTTSGSMSLFWTPLETQINEGGDGSSEGEDDDVTVEFDAGYISNEDTVFVPESADRVYLSIGGGNGHLALPNDNSYKRIEIIQEGTTGGNIDIFGQPSSNSQYLDVVAGDWQGIGIGIRNREGFWRIIEN